MSGVLFRENGDLGKFNLATCPERQLTVKLTSKAVSSFEESKMNALESVRRAISQEEASVIGWLLEHGEPVRRSMENT